MTHFEREEQARVMAALERDARMLAEYFRLPLHSVAPEAARVKRRYGICYSDGTIRIRLRHVCTGKLLKYSGLIDTLCHELAHLRHFNHGRRFKAFYRTILGRARRTGIYRPAPRGSCGIPPSAKVRDSRRDPLQAVGSECLPRQLSLF